MYGDREGKGEALINLLPSRLKVYKSNRQNTSGFHTVPCCSGDGNDLQEYWHTFVRLTPQ